VIVPSKIQKKVAKKGGKVKAAAPRRDSLEPRSRQLCSPPALLFAAAMHEHRDALSLTGVNFFTAAPCIFPPKSVR